jgi:hypothetical protein
MYTGSLAIVTIECKFDVVKDVSICNRQKHFYLFIFQQNGQSETYIVEWWGTKIY